MPQISVIVPVYNVEKYIHRCIDSILAQTFTDFELILVDDGSPDNCGVICDEYAAKDSRVKVIHKRNNGVSAARNDGLDIAEGQYIMFCDSDDYVETEWCEIHLNAVLAEKECWVVSNISRVSDQGTRKTVVSDGGFPKGHCTYYDIYKLSLSGSACNKIYSREILEKNELRFNSKICIGEDAVFNARYARCCRGTYFLPESMYNYRDNGESALHRYRYDWLEQHLQPFYSRVTLIDDKYLAEYCDGWLYLFVCWFDVVFDPRCKMTFFKKLQYNQRMIRSEEFGYCLEHASGSKESPLLISVLKMRNYYVYWLFDSLVKLKRKIKETLT